MPQFLSLRWRLIALSTLLFIFSYTLLIKITPTEAQDPVRPTAVPAYTTCTQSMLDTLGAEYCGGGGIDLPSSQLKDTELQLIQAQITHNIEQLTAQGRLTTTNSATTLLAWPLQPSHTLVDPGYHWLSFFVDHAPDDPNVARDYACGGRTFNNSTGTVFVLWPFGWNKMYNDEVQVVSAADGVIVNKQDGNDDQSCVPSDKGLGNAIYIRHTDGVVAWYGHLKKGSLTPKLVGDNVLAGEYLGIVGSSGSSESPRLYFVLRDENNQVVDPYEGTCNPVASRWLSQPPYSDSAINKVITGSRPPESPTCPNPEVTNIQDSFTVGNTIYTIYFTTFYRDERATQQSQYTIYRPDGSIYAQWQHTSPASYSWSLWVRAVNFNQAVPTGTWRVQLIFEGKTHQTYFNINDPTFILLSSPNGSEQWQIGSTQRIRWNDNLGGDVRIELHKGAAYHSTVVIATPSSGDYTWVIPTTLPPAADYRIRIVNNANPTLYDDSNRNFAIAPPPTPTFTSTPTFTPTPTASHTPTPTSTPTILAPTFTPPPTITPIAVDTPVTGQNCNAGSSTDTRTCANYLPMIIHSNTQVVTPIPAWRQIAGSGLNSAAVAVQGNNLFVGVRENSVSEHGLYRGDLSACRANVALSKVSDINRPGGESVLGISFINNSGVAASYDSGIYYTTNGGLQWTLSPPPLPNWNPQTVAIAGDNFFAGTRNNGVYLSQNGGVTWQQRRNEPKQINTIAIDAVDSSLVWIGADNSDGQPGGVWRLNISDVDRLGRKNEGLTGAALKVWDFAFDNNNIYIATEGGVYQATTNSVWSLAGAPPAGVRFRSLVLIGTTLYAGAFDQGVWRRALPSVNWEQVRSGLNEGYTVRDLLYQPNECGGLLAATNNGVWLYPTP